MLKVAYDPIYVHPLNDGHRFPMEKYDLLKRQLVHEGTIEESQIFSCDQIDITYAEKVHTKEYLKKLYEFKVEPREQRATGFIHNPELIIRESTIMEGTRKCAEIALSCGAAMNIAGGTHHAFSDRGEGFCLMNDQAIAAKWLLKEGLAKKILIVDLDVHQGNGTAEIFRYEPEVFTFSMHGKNNYPLKKEISDLDIELKDGIRDQEYLYLLEKSLEKAMAVFNPEFIFYQCGVDILESDQLGKLSVSMDGCKKRDEFIFRTVKQLGVPVVCTMGGGYSKDLSTIVEAHANTFRVIQNTLF